MQNQPVSMQRNPTGSMPAPGAGGYTAQGQFTGQQQGQYKPPMPGAPPQQYGGPGPSQPFNMAGGPPAPYSSLPPPQSAPYSSQPPPQSAPYNTAPTSYNNPPPQNTFGSAPPYASAPPSYGGQQQYGSQQPYGNPPLQQFPSQPPNMATGGYVGSVSLNKGGNMSLSKANPNLSRVRIGLGWDVRQTGGPAFDLDASAFMLKGDGRVRMSQDLIFYNNKQSVDGSVWHHGDNLTGVGEGDDEIVSIDLMRVPPEIQKIVFVVSIYEAEMRQQNFGMVSRAFIRVVDDATHQEMCRFDLTEEASLLNTMIFGEVYRYGNEWKFRAVGQGIQGGLKSIGGMFGLNLQ